MGNRKRIIEIYIGLDRSFFMEEHKECAGQDIPFSIGHGQTISQPSLVLEMTILLDLDEDSKVLEIGTGSGYQTAILAKASEKVYTIERIEELLLKAKVRLNDKGFENIRFKLGDGSLGWEENAPYDRIMVTASATNLPEKLVEQLAPNGKMIIPVGESTTQDLLLITKDSKENINKEVISKVRFVRLIGDY